MLPSCPDRSPQVGKPLLQIQTINVGRWGRARGGRQVIAKLYESPEGVADMQIALEQKPMQVIRRTPAGRKAEERAAKVLHPLLVLPAEVKITPRRDIERNELERRPEVFRQVRAILVARNVIIAQEVIGRLRVPQHLGAQPARGGNKRRQH
jgi:hypothetical protein